jgi:uncharacterized membrane protein YfcA
MAARDCSAGLTTVDWLLLIASFGIGIVVGMTGMGGGALMTPALIFFFNVNPLVAISSDLVASAVMKPAGAFVHLRRRTVNLRLVGWLCMGSVPAAFCGVLLTRSIADGEALQDFLQKALGVALLIAAVGLIVRAYLRLLERARIRDGVVGPYRTGPPEVVVRPIPTVIVGALGGLVVGITSVGSGSLIIITLMVLYPGLKAAELVGTDLVQAVPLVASAAVSHLFFGDFSLSLTVPMLLGAVPGAFIGAQISSRAPGGLVRRALAFVLLASALKLLGVSTPVTGVLLALALMVAPPLWMVVRRNHGFPARSGSHWIRRPERERDPA